MTTKTKRTKIKCRKIDETIEPLIENVKTGLIVSWFKDGKVLYRVTNEYYEVTDWFSTEVCRKVIRLDNHKADYIPVGCHMYLHSEG